MAVDHTPSADLKSGTVVVVGDRPFVTVTGIAADQLGSVKCGGGDCTLRAVAGGDVVGGGLPLYWDDTAKKVLGGTGGVGNKMIGYTLPDQAATADTDEIEFVFSPDGSTGT